MRLIGLDLREKDRLRETFDQLRPDAVIHTAALADIDYCQSHRGEAEQVNVQASLHLADLCREFGARLVFCSTDTVFDGRQGRYREEDPPHPVNYYGETKFRAERLLLNVPANIVVARLALVLGLPMIEAGNSFLARMKESLEAGRSVTFPREEIRSPIDVVTLGRALLELAEADLTGVLHLAGNTSLNRHEMGLQIAARLGYPAELVKPASSDSMRGRAPRPADASLDNAKARRLLRTPMLSLAEGLDVTLTAAEK